MLYLFELGGYNMYNESKISQAMMESYKRFHDKNIKHFTGLFATKWSNINPEMYFDCMFEDDALSLDNIMSIYKFKDKDNKVIDHNLKESFIMSLKLILSYMKKHDMKELVEYCNLRDLCNLKILEHFMKGYVSKLFLVLMIRRRYVVLNDDDRASLPGYVFDDYRNTCYVLDDMEDFITESMIKFNRNLINGTCKTNSKA